jgi:hypothetical protein
VLTMCIKSNNAFSSAMLNPTSYFLFPHHQTKPVSNLRFYVVNDVL